MGPSGFTGLSRDKAALRLVAVVVAFVVSLSGIPCHLEAHASAPSLAKGVVAAQPVKAMGGKGMLGTQAQSDMTVFGADVSQWQGQVNWKKAASQLQFAIIRCGYGDNLRFQDDTRWLENVRKCRKNGIPMGVYLYSYATNVTMARSEANHVIRCLREAGLNASMLELPIYLDMEDASTEGMGPEAYEKVFGAFKKRLNSAGYQNVGVYANSDWWSWRLSTIDLPSECRWVAQWGNGLFAGYPTLAEKGCGVWQYTDSAAVAGMRGGVDGNYARYDLPFLRGSKVTASPVKNNNNRSDAPKVFVLYNATTRDYLYTTDTDEKANLLKSGWQSKTALGKVPNTTSMPVFRFYNDSTKSHYYTTSKAKFNKLARKRQWAYEGIAFYSQLPNLGTPVNRFTKSGKYRCAKEDALKGWKPNGVCWYAA